jgi:hypothetical protein
MSSATASSARTSNALPIAQRKAGLVIRTLELVNERTRC